MGVEVGHGVAADGERLIVAVGAVGDVDTARIGLLFHVVGERAQKRRDHHRALSSTELSSIVIVPLSRMPPPSVNQPFGGFTAEPGSESRAIAAGEVPGDGLRLPPPAATLAADGSPER